MAECGKLSSMEKNRRLGKLCCALLIAGTAAQSVNSAFAQPVEAVVGGTSFKGTFGDRVWIEFQRKAEAAANGGLKLRMLVRGELGAEEQIVSGLRRGRVQYANLSALVTSTVVPEAGLLYAPYLFDSEVEADYVIDSYLTAEFRKLLAASGLELIAWYDLGASVLWSRKKPLLTPGDLRGVRLRIGANRAMQLLGQSLRADVIPLPFSDIIPSLQRGLIEAGENGLPLYSRTGIAREAPHMTLTEHNLAVSFIVADKRWFDRQTPALQKILRSSFPPVAALRHGTRQEMAADIAGAGKLGFKVYGLTPAQKQQWATATRGTHPAIVAAVGGDSARLYAGIQAARKAYAAKAKP
jgi:TRAP-type C4-dicarboxylate transport system substrate-binding protein